MEIYEADSLIDVVVATALTELVLRGARRAVPGGQPRVIAWGRLPADGEPITVTFIRRRFRLFPVAAQRTEIIKTGTSFWLAIADGRFDRVAVSHGARRERLAIAAPRRRAGH